MTHSRRNFIRLASKYSLGGVVLSSLPLSAIAAMRKPVSANETLNLGLIGANGMGWANNNWERTIKFPGWKMYLNSTQAYVANENFKKYSRKLEILKRIKKYYNDQFGYNNTFPGGYTMTNLSGNPFNTEWIKQQGLI